MKKMELAVTKRDGYIIKHISNLEVLNKGPYYTPEVVQELAKDCPRFELEDVFIIIVSLSLSLSLISISELRDKDSWILAGEEKILNIGIISHGPEETSILRSDIKVWYMYNFK